MPPQAKLAGLILLLACPVSVAAQTTPSNGATPSPSARSHGQPETAWVTASRQASPTPTSPVSERLTQAITRQNTFESSAPVSNSPNASIGGDPLPASRLTPAESSGVASATAPPPADYPPENSPSPYPAMPPPGTRASAPGGKSSGQFGGMASLLTTGGSLALVLGLFMLMAWIMRRTVPGAVQALPGDVMEVLGRASLTGRQQVHLVRIGNKLILVSVTPEGAETLTEITDAQEVDRLAGLCRETHPGSATNAFRQVFGQLARQPTETGGVVDSGELDLSGMSILQPSRRGAGEHR